MVAVQKAVPGSDLRAGEVLFGERRQGWGRIASVIRPGVSNLYSVTFQGAVEENWAGVRFQTLKAKSPMTFFFPKLKMVHEVFFPSVHAHTLQRELYGVSQATPKGN